MIDINTSLLHKVLAKNARNIISQHLFTERLAVHQPHLLVNFFQGLLRDELSLDCATEQHFQ